MLLAAGEALMAAAAVALLASALGRLRRQGARPALRLGRRGPSAVGRRAQRQIGRRKVDEGLNEFPAAVQQRERAVEDPGDALIPQQPVGRLVAKGNIAALEYDPTDAPEFIAGPFGEGEWSWEPLTPEGGLLDQDEAYAEMAVHVPSDRLQYMKGAGYFLAQEGEDYRAYIDSEVVTVQDRDYQKVTLRGSKDSVGSGGRRLMAGVLHRRPWDPPREKLPAAPGFVAPLPA